MDYRILGSLLGSPIYVLLKLDFEASRLMEQDASFCSLRIVHKRLHDPTVLGYMIRIVRRLKA